MKRLLVEIKAFCNNQDEIRGILKSKKAEFKGVDHQIDTYFKVINGRLKLREGNIENNLIYYERLNMAGPTESKILLYNTTPKSEIKKILTKSNGILIIVDKKREIYFIDNVKFHLDNVKGLGTFIEIKAIDGDENIKKEKLLKQCNSYIKLFNIDEKNLITNSYSDMMIEKK